MSGILYPTEEPKIPLPISVLDLTTQPIDRSALHTEFKRMPVCVDVKPDWVGLLQAKSADSMKTDAQLVSLADTDQMLILIPHDTAYLWQVVWASGCLTMLSLNSRSEFEKDDAIPVTDPSMIHYRRDYFGGMENFVGSYRAGEIIVIIVSHRANDETRLTHTRIILQKDRRSRLINHYWYDCWQPANPLLTTLELTQVCSMIEVLDQLPATTAGHSLLIQCSPDDDRATVFAITRHILRAIRVNGDRVSSMPETVMLKIGDAINNFRNIRFNALVSADDYVNIYALLYTKLRQMFGAKLAEISKSLEREKKE